MIKFKPEQKVAFIGFRNATNLGAVISPKENQVVTIKILSGIYANHYLIYGFESDADGQIQHFDWSCFKPLQYESASLEILEKFPLTEEKADVKIREHEEQLINQ